MRPTLLLLPFAEIPEGDALRIAEAMTVQLLARAPDEDIIHGCESTVTDAERDEPDVGKLRALLRKDIRRLFAGLGDNIGIEYIGPVMFAITTREHCAEDFEALIRLEESQVFKLWEMFEDGTKFGDYIWQSLKDVYGTKEEERSESSILG